MKKTIRLMFNESRQTYGGKRVVDEPRDQGIRCNRSRGNRLMKEEGP